MPLPAFARFFSRGANPNNGHGARRTRWIPLLRRSQPRTQEEQSNLVESLKQNLEAAYPGRRDQDGDSNAFLILKRIRQATTREDVHELFKTYQWYKREELEEYIGYFSKVIATLITIN